MPFVKRAASPTPLPDSPHPSTKGNVVAGKKRKVATPQDLDSPAPQDRFGVDGVVDGPVPLTEGDLTRAAQSAIARLPMFVPVAEDSPYYNTSDIPYNRQGFRYIPACSSPGSKTVDKTAESPPQCVRFSWEDRSPYAPVTQDGLSITTDKGFRSARCNVPVREGKWYMEVLIEKGGGDGKGEGGRTDGSHVRLGWGRREAPLNGPVGLDAYSYGIRDLTGDKVTLSRPRSYGQPFGTGDVVGMYISLPHRKPPSPKDPQDPARIARKRIPIQYKGQVYYESLEYPQSKEMMALMDYSGKPVAAVVPAKKEGPGRGPPGRKEQDDGPQSRPLPTLRSSAIAFFVNGEPQGAAFRDIYDFLQLRPAPATEKTKGERRFGMDAIMKERENNFDDGSLGYYPFISVFNNARIRINPGPDFTFPPPNDIDKACGLPSKGKHAQPTWRPLSERYDEFMAETWAQDSKDAVASKEEADRMEQDAAVEDAEEAKKQERLKRNRERAAQRRKEKAAASGAKSKETRTRVSATPAASETPAAQTPAAEPVSTRGWSEDLDPSVLRYAASPPRDVDSKSDDLDASILEAATSNGRPRHTPHGKSSSAKRAAVKYSPSPAPAPTGRAFDYTDSEDEPEHSGPGSVAQTPAHEEAEEADEVNGSRVPTRGSVGLEDERNDEEEDVEDDAISSDVMRGPRIQLHAANDME